MGKTKHEVRLSDIQLSVVRVIWARGEATTTDVVAGLGAKRGLAHTTVATLLSRLEKRGVLAHRRDGRTLVYRALVSESEVQRSMVASLIGSLFKGDPAALVAHLVREEELAPGDLNRIRTRVKEAGHE
jgi:predicted transcriptional regulator